MLFWKKKEKESINLEVKSRIVTIIDTINDFSMDNSSNEKINRIRELIDELNGLYHSNYKEFSAACLACGVDEEDLCSQLWGVEVTTASKRHR